MNTTICTNYTANAVVRKTFLQKAFSFTTTKSQRFFYLMAMMLFAGLLNAQTTYTWNFTNATQTTGSNANLTLDTFKPGNILGSSLSTPFRATTVASGGYTGSSAGNNIGNACKTGVFASGTSAYFELNLTPAAGYVVKVTGLTFGRRCTGTGPQRYVVKTSRDSYVDSLAADTMANNSNWALESPLINPVTSQAGTALTIRIFGYNGTGSASNGTITWRIDDVTLTVEVNALPAAPTSGGNQNACTGGSIPDLSASSSGNVIDWYANSSGGTALTSGSNTYTTGQTAANTYTYYAEARNTTTGLVSATRTAVSLTINTTVTPSVSAVVDDNTPTAGQTIQFTATPTNGGATPGYQWYKNSNPISLATNNTYSTNNNYANGDVFYVVMTSNAVCASPTTAQSGNVTISVDNSGCSGTPPTATTVASSTNVCSGSSSNLSLTGLGGASGYTFQWQTSTTQNGSYSNTSSADTNSTYTATNITTALWYRCVVTCTNGGASTPSNAVQINVTANLTPAVTISTTTNPSCAGASVTYTATPVNGGSTPSYQWFLNGSVVGGQTTSTYTTSSLTDGNTIYAVLTTSYACPTKATDTSSTVTHNVTANAAASVSISLTSGANPACAGATLVYTATPTNGGSTPAYQWYNGASPIGGETNSSYSSNSITNGSSITVRMTSSLTCVTGSPATSNAISQGITTNVTPSVTIASNNNPVCNSGDATFTATPTNGGTPSYVWYLNGNVVSGQTTSTYTLSPVTNGDSVYAIMTSTVTCVTTSTATSNGIKETIVTPSAPSVSISANPGTSINEGTNITFTATPTFGGTTPSYQWKVNGTNVGTNSANYSSSTLGNGDQVTCAMVSNYTCATTPNATSNTLTISILGAVPFTPGNIIVYRVGDSATALSANGSAVFLSEYTPSGVFVQSKRLSRTTSGVNTIQAAGTSTSEGMLNLNTNGLNLAVPGYNAAVGNGTSLSASASATIKRICVLVDINQNQDTTTKLKDWSTGSSPRSVMANGNTLYVSGGAGGVRVATKGDTVSTQLSTTVTNLRNLGIFNGQLYTSSQSGAFRMATVGSGLPTTNGQTITNLPGFSTSTGSPYGYYFADLSGAVAGVDVLYVADDNTNNVTKYSLVGGNWTSNGSITVTGARGLTGSVSGGTVKLYVTAAVTSPVAGTFVYSITDASGYNASLTGSASTVVDRSSVSLIAFRGIAFAPTAITTQPASGLVCTGSTKQFSVAMASGANATYTYQWQASGDNGSNWSNISNGSVYSGVTGTTVTILDPTGLNNVQYRCQITYMSNCLLTSNAATLTVETTVTPSVSISTASDTVCSGSVTTFTATGTNPGPGPVYTWKQNGISVGSGSSISFSAGTLSTGDVISCTLTANNNCQTTNTANSNAYTMYVKQSPTVGTSSVVKSILCTIGSTTVADNSNTLGGGVWSSSNESVVTVTTNSGSAGTVTAVGNGTATLTYSKVGSGCTSTASVNITVAQVTTPNSITGTNSICKGNTTQLATTSSGGVWSSQNNYASVNGTGLVTGLNAGTAVIRYTVTNASSCSAYVSYNVTVNPTPNTPSIGYASGSVNPQVGSGGTSNFCLNRTFTVVGSPSGGVWSSSNTGRLTVSNPGGAAETVGLGAVSLTYTYTTGAGCSNSKTISGTVVTCASRGVNTNVLATNDASFTLYPNPANTVINLQVKSLVGTGSIIVTDLYGKQVKQQALSMGTNAIDVSRLAKGMYLLSIITSDGKQTQKVIVE